jgi:hypothetical protein
MDFSILQEHPPRASLPEFLLRANFAKGNERTIAFEGTIDQVTFEHLPSISEADNRNLGTTVLECKLDQSLRRNHQLSWRRTRNDLSLSRGEIDNPSVVTTFENLPNPRTSLYVLTRMRCFGVIELESVLITMSNAAHNRQRAGSKSAFHVFNKLSRMGIFGYSPTSTIPPLPRC